MLTSQYLEKDSISKQGYNLALIYFILHAHSIVQEKSYSHIPLKKKRYAAFEIFLKVYIYIYIMKGAGIQIQAFLFLEAKYQICDEQPNKQNTNNSIAMADTIPKTIN